MTFARRYDELVSETMSPVSSFHELNARTGVYVSVAKRPLSFSVDLSQGLLPVPHNRRYFPATAAAETAWFISGRRDLQWLGRYTKIWQKFAEPDGTVEAAYGYRWRHHFGRDQLASAIEVLKRNPSDRRVYVSAWDPSSDGLGAEGQRNVPCPVGFTLSLVGGRLNSALVLRSSDVFVGLPYDVMGHALLMAAVATSLGRPLGSMHVTLAHAHIYEPHFEMVNMGAEQSRLTTIGPAIKMPAWSVEQVEASPDVYVVSIKARADAQCWPTYSPKPELVV